MGQIKKEIFPPEVQEFAREIHEHPKLIQFLEEASIEYRQDLSFILAATASYLNIPIDGYFSGQEIIDLMHDFNLKLKDRRKSIIIQFPGDPTSIN